jgi:adenosylcobinamide-phosphate synthase
VVLASALERRTTKPLARTLVTAAATWAVLGARSLAVEGRVMASLLAEAERDGDLGPARARLSHLAGRDPAGLDAAELSRAGVESLAENTSDAVVAPLLWGAVAGLPGLVGYRAVNTLDAMVGHRSPRYHRFGWASARLDDVTNYLPARVTAGLAALAGGRPVASLAAWRRDAGRHPSPNAGPVEAAFAGALGLRLGGANVYAGQVEDRGYLGDGRPPARQDLERAVRLSLAVDASAVLLAGGVAWVLGRRR